MSKVTLVMPMAGLGTRIKKASKGKTPKPFIKLPNGNPLFREAMRGIPLDYLSSIVFVVMEDILEKPEYVDHFSSSIWKVPVDVITLDKPTKGQAETVVKGIEHLGDNRRILVWNCDSVFIDHGLRGFIDEAIRDGIHSFTTTFKDGDMKWNFIDIDKKGNVVKVSEKKFLSWTARPSTGLYYFKSVDYYRNIYEETVKSMPENEEIYISNMLKTMLSKKHIIKSNTVLQFGCFGTDSDYESYVKGKRYGGW